MQETIPFSDDNSIFYKCIFLKDQIFKNLNITINIAFSKQFL